MNEDKKNRKEDTGVSPGELHFAENFLAAAEDIYADKEPLSDRHQCLSKDSIHKIIDSDALPDEKLRSHLFDCPECFTNYREALANKTSGTVNDRNWTRIFSLPMVRFAAVGVAAGVIFALMIFSFWRFEPGQKDDLAKDIKPVNSNNALEIAETSEKKPDSQPGNEVPENESNAAEKKSEPQSSAPNSKILLPGSNSNSSQKIKSSSKTKPETPPVIDKTDKETISLVLDENKVLRNKSNNSEISRVTLPGRKLNLKVKLPGGYPAGQYLVRITDAFGNILLERRTVAKNGTLNLEDFDLRSINKPAGKICLKTGDEIPDCFDVKILK